MNPAPALAELTIGDDPESWRRAGFAVEGASTVVGGVRLVLAGAADGRGIRSLGLEHGGGPPIDGIATHAAAQPTGGGWRHANGAVDIDHLVVVSPDERRTMEALTARGFELRRQREVEIAGAARRQSFYWFGGPGEVILELVAPVEPEGHGPAMAWGLAFTVDDLDVTVAWLGDGCSAPRRAVQPGRRITSLRHRDLGVSVPVAFMTPHPDRA